MLFNSFAYAIFLPIVFILYWVLPNGKRWILLLISSYYFYMSWNPKYLVLILLTTAVSYIAAILIDGQESILIKNRILTACALVCLGTLFVFKYFNFFSESLNAIFIFFSIPLNPVLLNVLLPVGISFYTFQTLSYVIDVYRGKVKAERHFGYYAVFISFFPQLVAGPIERTDRLLPQIKKEHHFNYENATYGLKLMAWGYFKKIVIADTISPYLNTIFSNPQKYTGFVLCLAIFFFAFQLYCDFSGYSDIAIGTAKLFDIKLMKNFASPFFSQSLSEYWSRWHISLSSWFRDYIYFPLGGSRKGNFFYVINIMITFLASGLWHGASWNYVVWGAANGVILICEKFFIPFRDVKSKGIVRWIRFAVSFLIFGSLVVFFANRSIANAIYFFQHFFDGIADPHTYFKYGFESLGMGTMGLIKILLMILLLCVFDYVSLTKDVIQEISSQKSFIRWTMYITLGLIIIFFSQKGIAAEFVYFQF